MDADAMPPITLALDIGSVEVEMSDGKIRRQGVWVSPVVCGSRHFSGRLLHQFQESKPVYSPPSLPTSSAFPYNPKAIQFLLLNKSPDTLVVLKEHPCGQSDHADILICFLCNMPPIRPDSFDRSTIRLIRSFPAV